MPRTARTATAIVLLSAGFSGCASMETFDTNAAVDARPECAAQPDRPDQPVPPWCERASGVTLSTERKSEPLDLTGKDAKTRGDDPA